MRACGLDFGTSNSTAGLAAGSDAALVALEGDAPTLPSAVFFDFETDGVAFGRAAIASYVAGADGRLMRSVKSALGTSLIDEDTALKRRRIGFREVIALLVGHIKAKLEMAAGGPVEAVVHGRPVRFVDGDDAADRRAQAALESIARAAGFREVSFQYEPIGAALAYEATLHREEVALIADIGGGTSDFSLVRIGPARRQRPDRADDILANEGVRIGGTDLDRLLSLDAVMPRLGYRTATLQGLPVPNHYFHDLATWARINFLYQPKTERELRQLERDSTVPERIARLRTVIEQHLGHALALEVERGKIALSDSDETRIDLSRVEPGLSARATRTGFGKAIAVPAERLGTVVRDGLKAAGLRPGDVDAVFLTGGSTLVPAVRGAILAELPQARVVEGDKFGAVGLGLTLEAARRYGVAAEKVASR